MPARWCWLHHIHPLENTEGVGFRGLFDGLGEEGVSPAVGSSSSWRCRTTVKQLHGSSHHVSTANELDYISLHLKRVQFKILLWKAADQIFSNSPGKPTPSVFSALTFCPCRQCRTLCRSGWIVCVGSKAAVSIWCPHILRMWHLLIGQYRPTSPSGWRDHPVGHSAMPSRPETRIYPCHHRGP